MNVGELMDELGRYRREEPVRIELPSVLVGAKCEECGSVAAVEHVLLRPVESRRLFHDRLTVFLVTEEV